MERQGEIFSSCLSSSSTSLCFLLSSDTHTTAVAFLSGKKRDPFLRLVNGKYGRASTTYFRLTGLVLAKCVGDVGEKLIVRLKGSTIEEDADGLARLLVALLDDGNGTRPSVKGIERVFVRLRDDASLQLCVARW